MLAPDLSLCRPRIACLALALACAANVQAAPFASEPHAQAQTAGGTEVEDAAVDGAAPAPDAAPTDDTDTGLKWSYDWKMWHGLDVSASRPTGIETGPNALPILNLEKVKFAGSLGGRVEVDAAAFDANGSLPPMNNGFALRRARLTAKGESIFGVGYRYRIDLGYASGGFTVTQAYVEIPGIRYLGTLEFGQFTPPVGLALITSSWDIAFMEPAAPLQAIAPPPQPGVQASNTFLAKRGTWTLGMYAGDGARNEYGSGSKRFRNVMGRATWLAIDDMNAERPSANRYLHLGASANTQHASSGTIRYRSRPESYIAPFVIDTGTIDASRAATLAAEVLWVDGAFSAQGEVIASRIEDSASSTLNFRGGYALARWALTGESRSYDRDAGTPGRLVPLRNFGFGPDAGWGAFDAAVRVSYTDLSDGAVQGGSLTMLMTSLDWTLRPQLKCMFELGSGRVRGAASGNGSFVLGQLRLGVYFF